MTLYQVLTLCGVGALTSTIAVAIIEGIKKWIERKREGSIEMRKKKEQQREEVITSISEEIPPIIIKNKRLNTTPQIIPMRPIIPITADKILPKIYLCFCVLNQNKPPTSCARNANDKRHKRSENDILYSVTPLRVASSRDLPVYPL